MPTVPRHRFEIAVRDTVRRRNLFPRDARVLAAISGGPDSTALVAALAALRENGSLAELHACHVDHRLRPGSRDDGAFCEELGAMLGVPVQRVEVTVAAGSSMQAAARRARYRALRSVADACNAEWIATGHTQSDQAETVVHRLLRGAGARGLGGIPPRRGRIVRPLIDRSRAEVVAYLRDRGLSWRDDPTNASPRYTRNRIRNEILPLLQDLAPGLERRLARTADLLRGDDRVLDGIASRALEHPADAAVAALLELPLALRRRAIRRAWAVVTGSRRHLGALHVEALVGLLGRKRPGRIALPNGFEARIAYGRFRIAPMMPPVRAPPTPAFAPILVPGPGSYPVPAGEGGSVVEIGWTSSSPPPWPVELRTRRAGDRFSPTQAPGGKKLKAWLIDRKVPRGERDALVVVADRKGRILAVPELGAVARGAEDLRVVVRPADPRHGR